MELTTCVASVKRTVAGLSSGSRFNHRARGRSRVRAAYSVECLERRNLLSAARLNAVDLSGSLARSATDSSADVYQFVYTSDAHYGVTRSFGGQTVRRKRSTRRCSMK